MKQIIHFSIGGIAAKASAQLDTDCTTDYLDVSSKFNLFETVLIPFSWTKITLFSKRIGHEPHFTD